MRYVSLFAGIEAASQAWHHMGWEPMAFADIDAFPSAVLAHHYPDVPNLGNVEGVDWSEYKGKAEVVVGGSPCQSFSVAGKRLGMDDPRGNLALEFIRAVAEIQPTWFVFENVPGLLSSDEGRDFGIFLGEVAKIGYGFAYRVLDSQFFGVPQRRRRVFVVGHIGGDWRSAASVLFERESLQGHSKESESQGKAITDYVKGSIDEPGGEPRRRVEIYRKSRRAQSKQDHETWVEDEVTNTLNTFDLGDIRATQLIAFEQNQRSEVRKTGVAGPIKAEKGSNNQTFIAQQKVYENHGMDSRITEVDVSPAINARAGTGGNNLPIVSETKNWDGKDKTGTLTTRSMQQFMPDKDNFMAVVEPTLNSGKESRQVIGEVIGFSHTQGLDAQPSTENFPTLRAEGGGHAIGFDWKNVAQTNFDKKNSGAPVTAEGGLAVKQTDMAVRRLTPLECERLQGFPDNYTQISWRGKAPEDCPDGPRYKALGNSMAVPVMRWIGEGIQIVDDLVNGLDEREDSRTSEQKSLFDF